MAEITALHSRVSNIHCIPGLPLSITSEIRDWPFWARCLKEIAFRSTLLYIKDIFLKSSVHTYGFNQ